MGGLDIRCSWYLLNIELKLQYRKKQREFATISPAKPRRPLCPPCPHNMFNPYSSCWLIYPPCPKVQSGSRSAQGFIPLNLVLYCSNIDENACRELEYFALFQLWSSMFAMDPRFEPFCFRRSTMWPSCCRALRFVCCAIRVKASVLDSGMAARRSILYNFGRYSMCVHVQHTLTALPAALA